MSLSINDENSTNKDANIDRHQPGFVTGDYKVVKQLGSGNFGKVFLVRHMEDESEYAMKVFDKSFIVKKNQMMNLTEEFTALKELDSPFVPKLFHVFDSAQNWYFVMEVCESDDFYEILEKIPRLGSPEVEFFMSELFCGVKYLHEKGIVHQDLKLDNLLLSHTGHLKISDFGLCNTGITADTKLNMYRGTGIYMPPEKVLGLDYTKAADWWTFGIILLQFFGNPCPFQRDCQKDNAEAIVNLTQNWIGKWTPKDAINLANNLLQYEKDRFTQHQISSHRFFRFTVWDDIENLRVAPPNLHEFLTPDPYEYDLSELLPVKVEVYTAAKGDENMFDMFNYKRLSMDRKD